MRGEGTPDPRFLLFEVVTHPLGPDVVPSDLLEEWFEPSRRRSARSRVSTYARMVRRRWEEAFEEDFPAVRRLLGGEVFGVHVRRYLREHPPSARSLNLVTRGFAEWIREVFGEGTPAAEIARLESLLLEVADEPTEPPVSADQLRSVEGEAALGARLRPVAASRVAAFEHDVVRWCLAVLSGGETPEEGPARRKTHALVRRDGFVVRIGRLDPDEAALLGDLGRVPLGEALERHCLRTGEGAQEAAARVAGWFREWAEMGLLTLDPR